ncbi:MAG TPA: anhydro-N-acetylmuramic acid kinase [Woeseiaceae bacterium]|nr:anhydro-N-acetylmuramic acid kinase [Woeseiaceae bacterium]
MTELYIGLLSGTSMDGIDAGLFEIGEHTCTTRSTLSVDYPQDLRAELQHASRHPGSCDVDAVGRLDTWVGECFMQAAQALLDESGVDRAEVRAIGSHGQTIRHLPRADRPFTLQIGDPNIIAAGTGLTTVADFRRRDLALGGEGAPLATGFHKWFLSDPDEHRVVLNIGGIANITMLPPQGGTVFGFDTGPGNTLLDAWVQSRKNLNFDSDGNWAGGGRVSEDLLSALLADPYFRCRPPKSTGFEYFNLAWLQRSLAGVTKLESIWDEDVQATLVALTATTIANAIRQYAPGVKRVLACGGGVRNGLLMRRLKEQLPDAIVESTAGHGIEPEWVEAATFAWLAKRCLDRQPGNLPEVTGASAQTVLGGVWYAPTFL